MDWVSALRRWGGLGFCIKKVGGLGFCIKKVGWIEGEGFMGGVYFKRCNWRVNGT